MSDTKKNNESQGGMIKVATFIVDKRNLFFLIYILLGIFCLFSRNWVKVENSMAAYLPETSETSIGLDLMDDQFITYGTANIMVTNISYEDAEALANELEALDSIVMLTFDSSPEHYSNFSALFGITFNFSEKDERCLSALDYVKERLSDYDIYVSTSLGDQTSEQIAVEMSKIVIYVAIVVVTVLIFTSQTYAEVPVLIITFLSSALVAMGTNFLLGTISFVSDSVTIVLQLALSVDYAVIFCNRYKEEHQTLNIHDATVVALSKAIPEICSSSLTTIGGLIAMMFMQFGIGSDMAICLIKAILLSLCSVFLLMPGLLVVFGPLMDKTKHKSFIPKIPFVGKFAYFTRFVVPFLFVGILVVAYIIQKNSLFVYGYSQLTTPQKNATQIAQEKIEETFGESNFVAFNVPAGNYEAEAALIKELESRPEVDYCQGLANTEAMDGYMLTDKLSARQFSELLDLDYNIAELVYTAYAVNDEDYAKVVSGISTYRVPLIDMLMFVWEEVNEGYVTLDAETRETLDDAHVKMSMAKEQLQGEKYSRILVYLNLPQEGEKTFAFLDEMHDIAKSFYEETTVVAGESTSQYDLCKTFDRDNIVVSLVSMLAVLVVLLFTFKSAGMPVLLIAVIEGSIWANYAVPAARSQNVFFMGYLIVSSIQMGANIDYAIVISSRFLELKNQMPKKQAIIETMDFAFPTIITSGSMLALSGVLIGRLTSDPCISGIGDALGRGTFISIFVVMFILPQILLLGEHIIDKTAFQVSMPIQGHHEIGLVRVDGYMSGQINGNFMGEIHGVINGEVNANVTIASHRSGPARLEKLDKKNEEVNGNEA